MAILYFDGFSGASGDMILGALLDLGVPRDTWEAELKKLQIEEGFTVHVSRESRHGIHGTRLVLLSSQGQHVQHRSFGEIRGILARSALSRDAKDLSLKIFQRLAHAEGKIHNTPPEDVTFHEIGALDSILDIVGAAIALEQLKPNRILASPLPLGHGFTQGDHGVLPLPAPATLELLRGVPVCDGYAQAELVTPTAAAILRECVESFGPLPPMRVTRIGYGVGSRDLPERPNLLRVLLGSEEGEGDSREDWVVEANIDDMNPEFCEHLMDRLLAQGALDVSWSPIIMKRGRPGGVLRVITEPHLLDPLTELIFRESTTIGVRTYPVRRRCLQREYRTVETPWGPVRIKISYHGQHVYNALPEYQDCRRIALETGLSLKEVYQEALAIHRREKSRP